MTINIISRIIAFEGIDGAGKDTQLQEIKKYLTNRSTPENPIFIINTCEPSDTAEGKKIRQLLSGQNSDTHSIQTIDKSYLFSLYLSDRKKNAQVILKRVKEIYQSYLTQVTNKSTKKDNSIESVKIHVLSSRCDLSSYAYQVEEATSSKDTLNKLDKIYQSHHYMTLNDSLNDSLDTNSKTDSLNVKDIKEQNIKNHMENNPKQLNSLIPDLTLYYDLDSAEAIRRINLRGNAEGFEKKASLSTIRKNYHQAIRYLSKKDGRKIITLDASKSLGEIIKETQKIFNDHVSPTN